MCYQDFVVPLGDVKVVWAVPSSRGNNKHVERVYAKLRRCSAQLFVQRLPTGKSFIGRSFCQVCSCHV